MRDGTEIYFVSAADACLLAVSGSRARMPPSGRLHQQDAVKVH